jgi:alanyl-tRNA synthetase
VRAATRTINSGQKRDRQGDLKVDLEAILARGLGRIKAMTTKGMVDYKRGERSHTAAAAAAAGGRETKVIHLGMIVQAVVGRQKELAEKVSAAIRDSRRADEEEEGITKAGQLQTQHFSFSGFSSFLDSYRQFDSHPTPQCSSVSQSEFLGGGLWLWVG